jgi:colanic acid/amylovoran biosynthesis protein
MNQKLTIEVQGIGFPNKGAELMLLAICDKIQHRYPDARICLPPNLPFRYRKNYPVYQLGRILRFGINFGLFLNFMPQKIRNMFGIVMPNEVDVILDASGFAYGDQWGAHKSRVKLSHEIEAFKKRGGRKVILLPQAFGPFANEKLRERMQVIINHADLIFARDNRSFDYLKGIDASEHIKLAPDFTNQFQTVSKKFDYLAEYPVCFIPNAKMLEMKTSSQNNSYVQFMVGLIKAAQHADHAPYILIHEGERDVALAEEIKALSGLDLPIVKPTDAEQVKQAIGVSKLVISSRFHGLVSALSQKIPVIATGWSHKYQALLSDYSVDDCIFDENVDSEKAANKMLQLLNEQTAYENIVNTITNRSIAEKNKTDSMWQQVFNELDKISG